MKLKNLFTIEYGQRDYTSKAFLEDRQGLTPLISSGASNNGFFGRFDMIPKYKRVISVARTGSVGWAFYHGYNCCVDDNCLVLSPRQKLSDEKMLYLTLLINKDRYRYMYGRQVTPKRLGDIELPDFPRFVDTHKLPDVSRLQNAVKDKRLVIKNKDWAWFKVGDIFDIERGKCGSAEKLLEKGSEISYVGAKKDENGFMYKVVRDEGYVTKGNCIVFIGDGQGSVGYSTYQENDFIGSTTLSMGRNESLNKFNAIFLITLLDKERFKYSFGRKWNGDKLKNTKVKLPVDKKGNPDWQFMEDYIKSLPYSGSI